MLSMLVVAVKVYVSKNAKMIPNFLADMKGLYFTLEFYRGFLLSCQVKQWQETVGIIMYKSFAKIHGGG